MKKILFALLLPISMSFGQSITLEPSEGIELNDPSQHIQYSDHTSGDVSMMYMFKNGTFNSNKMVISHSAAFPKWGLQYEDGTDEFVFRSTSKETMSLNLNSGFVEMHNNAKVTKSLTVDMNADITGTTTSGVVSTPSLQVTNGGNAQDFLVKSNTTGNVINKKGNNRVAVNYIIATIGTFPSSSSVDETNKEIAGNDPFLGEITMFAGNFAPRGWAFCDGQILPISSYSALFSVLGTTYGGDGRHTFALPDLRAAAPVHEGSRNGITWSLGEKD